MLSHRRGRWLNIKPPYVSRGGGHDSFWWVDGAVARGQSSVDRGQAPDVIENQAGGEAVHCTVSLA